jgi:murein DD-endopeptidase MepM/ murein hydrolase activator NlpD
MSLTRWVAIVPLDPFFAFYGQLGWRYPLNDPRDREISSGYYLDRPVHGFHVGIDIVRGYIDEQGQPAGAGAIINQPVHSVHSGRVLHSEWFGNGGNTVMIESSVISPTHGGFIVSRYMHMFWGAYRPTVGSINMGTRIGLVGDTGSPGNVHLHLDFNGNSMWNVSGSADIRPYLLNPQRFFPNIEFTQHRIGSWGNVDQRSTRMP